MKTIILLIAIFVLSGCASHPYRTGKIVINQFATEGCKINNPMQVRDDDVDRMSDNLHKEIIKSMPLYTKLTIGKDCNDADFELTGKFDEVKAEFDSHWRVVTVKVTQEFDVAVSGVLKECKTGKVLADFDPGEDGQSIPDIIEHLGERVAKYVAKDKTIILKD